MVKKIVLLATCFAWISGVYAQTNFRDLNYAEAIQAAKAENKMVFMDFYTVWCGPCKMMMRDIFPQKAVGDYMNDKFVCIKIDAEKGEGPELFKRYGGEAYPTFVIIDTDEKVLFTKVGASDNGTQFISGIKTQIDPDFSPARLRARYAEGERTAELISTYAGMLMEQVYAKRQFDMTKRDTAFTIVREYFEGLNDAQRLASENAFIYTAYTESSTDEIAAFMIQNCDRFPQKMQKEISAKINELYKSDIYRLLTAQAPFEATRYNTIKQGIINAGLNSENQYTAAFILIESYAGHDPMAFLETCRQEYDHLNDDFKSILVSGFANLFKTEPQTVKKQAAAFLRSQLKEMNSSWLYSVAGQLSELEGDTNVH